jgi:hypothetical protein
MSRLALALCLALAPLSAHAGDWRTGEELLQSCLQTDGPGGVFCLGYLMGVAASMVGGPVYGYSACIPPGVTGRDLADVTIGRLVAMPERAKYGAAGVVAHTFAVKWPCTRART